MDINSLTNTLLGEESLEGGAGYDTEPGQQIMEGDGPKGRYAQGYEHGISGIKDLDLRLERADVFTLITEKSPEGKTAWKLPRAHKP